MPGYGRDKVAATFCCMGQCMTYSPDEIEKAKGLYLELLACGKTEREIDEVSGIPTWATRWQWKQDVAFSTQCQKALEHGAEYTLTAAEKKLEEAITRAEDEACPPQLPPLVKELMSHARWKAKCFSKKYSDKIALGGAEDMPPIKVDGKVEIVHVVPK